MSTIMSVFIGVMCAACFIIASALVRLVYAVEDLVSTLKTFQNITISWQDQRPIHAEASRPL